jgi:hypothetical protein
MILVSGLSLASGLSHKFVCDLLDGTLMEGLVGLDRHLWGGGLGRDDRDLDLD